MKNPRIWRIAAVILLLAVLLAAGLFLLRENGKETSAREDPDRVVAAVPVTRTPFRTDAEPAADEDGDPVGGGDDEEDEDEPQTEEEKAEAAAEAKVDAFDELTDRWMEPAKSGVTMKDIDTFAAVFRQVPKDRQDECIHRALNLVPDENIMLLAGILMDKTMDQEIVETVFNDVLNRDEDVKKPILQQIFKDKTHPCWADTAWILDVTDELPVKQEAP